MRRIIAAIAVAAGLLLAAVGFAQPAAAYNNAPASHICAYIANSQPNLAIVTYCRDINWWGHYGVHFRLWFPSLGYNGCGSEGVYDRHDGIVDWITTWCA